MDEEEKGEKKEKKHEKGRRRQRRRIKERKEELNIKGDKTKKFSGKRREMKLRREN